jgi:hypothetical protein
MRESVTVPGPACDRLAAAARRAGAVLVAGVNEREEHGGTVFNTESGYLTRPVTTTALTYSG